MSYKKTIALIILLSVIVKLAFLFLSGAYQNLETFEYERMAGNLLANRGFYYDHFNTRYYGGDNPGFPLLCFLIYRIFGHHQLLVVLLQVLATSFLVVPIAAIAKRIFGRTTALLAGLLVGLHPGLIVYSTAKLHTMNIYSLLFAFFVLSFFKLREKLNYKTVISCGIIAGITALFRITILGFLFIGLFWFYLVSKETAKKKIQASLFIILIFAAILTPWCIRNRLVFGKLVFFQTNKWESLWFGNAPGSKGSLYGQEGVAFVDKQTPNLPQEFFKKSEIEQGLYLKQLTIGYFKQDPPAFISRIFKKMYYFWYFSPYQGSLYPKLWMRLYKAYYLVILFPALLSLILNLFFILNKERSQILLILILFAAITFTHALYFVEARHRWSVEAFLLIFTANGLIIIKDYVQKAKWLN